LEQSVKALEQRLEQLQHDHESLRVSIEGNNRAAVPSIRNSEASSATAADGTHHSKEMETRVRDLHEQVAMELESLSLHQQELEQARPSLTGGEIKQAVKQLSEQVLTELCELQDHQHELGKFRTVMARLPEAGSASGHDKLPRMEAKVQDVSKQVSDELQALVDQQAGLGRAHETIYGMMMQLEEGFGRIADCQRDMDPRKHLQELRST